MSTPTHSTFMATTTTTTLAIIVIFLLCSSPSWSSNTSNNNSNSSSNNSTTSILKPNTNTNTNNVTQDKPSKVEGAATSLRERMAINWLFFAPYYVLLLLIGVVIGSILDWKILLSLFVLSVIAGVVFDPIRIFKSQIVQACLLIISVELFFIVTHAQEVPHVFVIVYTLFPAVVILHSVCRRNALGNVENMKNYVHSNPYPCPGSGSLKLIPIPIHMLVCPTHPPIHHRNRSDFSWRTSFAKVEKI
eukprot:c11576_g1_i3.p2 GENE.c11576_g1_i3~~c11576_g1_i3.p2  ORF type:complete len:247 (+),score=62.71 c11576_g1_i3:561-1301(+)